MPIDSESLESYPGDLDKTSPQATSDIRGFCAQGKRLLTLNRAEEATALFQHALDLDPDYAPAHVLLAASWLKRRNYEMAIMSCHEALRIRPSDAYSSFYLGFAHLGLDKINDALDAFRYARQYQINDPEAFATMGGAYA